MHIRKIRNHAISAVATLAITWSAAFSAFAATVALALCVTDANAATLTPTTAHDDVPGDATLKEIVEGAGATEALEAEAKERKAADEEETTERKAADAALQTNIVANDNSIASEADARKAADEAEATERGKMIAAETTARKDADAALVSSLSDLSDALTAETKSRVDADNANATAVDNEATARENADMTLQGSIDAVSSNLSSHVSTTSGNPHGVTAADVKVSISNGVVAVDGEKSAALDAGDGRGIALGSATNKTIVATLETNTLTTVDKWAFSARQNSNYLDSSTGRGANQTNVYTSVLYPDGGRILTDKMIPTSNLGEIGSVKRADKAEHAASADAAKTAEGLLADDDTQFLKYTNADDDPDSDDEDWAWRLGYTIWYDSTTHTNVTSRLIPDGTDFVTKKTLDAATADAGKVQSVNSQTGAVVITAADLSAVTHDEKGYVGINGDLGVGGKVSLASSLELYGDDGYITAKGITTENGFTVGDPDGENISFDKYGIVFGGGGTTLVERDAISSTSVGALDLTVSRTNVTEHFWATNNPHGVTAAQVGALTAESDPTFAAWKTNEVIVIGKKNTVYYYKPSIVIGSNNVADSDSNIQQVIVIGNENKADESEGGIYIGNELSPVVLPDGRWTKHAAYFHVPWNPSRFVFCGASRDLQSYLDERATTNALAAVEANASSALSTAKANAGKLGTVITDLENEIYTRGAQCESLHNDIEEVKAAIPVIDATDETFSNAVNVAARALVKAKLESLDKAKSSIGETIAALQSIYNETETK